VLVLFNLIKLRLHGEIVLVSDLLGAEIFTQAISPEDDVIEFIQRHVLGSAGHSILTDKLLVD